MSRARDEDVFLAWLAIKGAEIADELSRVLGLASGSVTFDLSAVPSTGTEGLVASGDDVVTGAEGGADGRGGGVASRVAGGGGVQGRG